MLLDALQLVVLIVAIGLQITATVMARPLRRVTPKRLWLYLVILNLAVLMRRFLSLGEVNFHVHGELDDTVAALIGLVVSVFMYLCIINLRRHLLHEQQSKTELAEATVELAHQTKTEDSGAYKLAVSLIREREQRNGSQAPPPS